MGLRGQRTGSLSRIILAMGGEDVSPPLRQPRDGRWTNLAMGMSLPPRLDFVSQLPQVVIDQTAMHGIRKAVAIAVAYDLSPGHRPIL